VVGARLVAEEDQPRGRAVELTEHGAGAGAADELEPPPVDEHGVVRPGAKEGVLDELCGGWPARLGGEMRSGDRERNLNASAAAQRPPPPTPALAPASNVNPFLWPKEKTRESILKNKIDLHVEKQVGLTI